MTEDIRAYSFDFKTEVGALRAASPYLRAHVSFFYVDVAPTSEETCVNRSDIRILQKIIAPEPIEHLPKDPRARALRMSRLQRRLKNSLLETYQDDPDYGSFFDSIPADYISIVKEDFFTRMLGEKNAGIIDLAGLYHEAGHALCWADEDYEDSLYYECYADAFSALYLLKRFGDDARHVLSVISWARSFNVMGVPEATDHLTTTVLDTLIADSATTDFSSLTLEDIRSRAEYYARNFLPSPDKIGAIKENFSRMHPHDIIQTIARKTLSAADDFTFYIGAKFLQPFLNPNGLRMDGELITLDDKARQALAAQIERRARHTGFQDIFNETRHRHSPWAMIKALFNGHGACTTRKTEFAENAADVTEPLTGYLPVTLPPGRKRIAVEL